jgi:undecaprenyl-phosphate 4-deoxy-4-formamido-L-arabinose transferase
MIASRIEFEIILVNDHSKDASWETIKSLSSSNDHVRGINLIKNFGQHNALLCGVRAARNEFIITMDDDLQHPPEEIPRLLAKLDEGFDVVYGTPAMLHHGAHRDFASKFTKYILSKLMASDIAHSVSSFRAFRTLIRLSFERFESPNLVLDALLTWGTSSFSSVTVDHQPRAEGVSNYRFRKLARHALNLITGFSVLPLQLATVMGMLFTAFGFFVLIYALAVFFFVGRPVPGFTFLASIIAIFSGAQMFVLGIIGEYLAQIYRRQMAQPTYIIRESVGMVKK